MKQKFVFAPLVLSFFLIMKITPAGIYAQTHTSVPIGDYIYTLLEK
jgi:hypothetical protein